MRTLTFEKHKIKNGDDDRPSIQLWSRGFRSIPVDLEPAGLIHQLEKLGFDDVISHPDSVGVGFLTAPWRNHPRLAMVVGRTMNFAPGDEFAISLEKAPPSPAGTFADAPTLQEICEEAYRQRRNGDLK